MKTKNLIYIIPILILFSCDTVEKDKTKSESIVNTKTDLGAQNINGAVESITEITYDLIDNTDSVLELGDEVSEKQTSFNNEGRISSIIFSDSYYSYETQNEYDENGFLIRTEEYGEMFGLEAIDKYKYDDKGFLIRQNEYDYDEVLQAYCLITNDEKGNPIKKEKFLESDDKLIYVSTCTYNEDNRLIESMYEYPYKFEYKNSTYFYDERGNKLTLEERDKDNVIQDTYKYEYKFDDQANWIVCIEYRNNTKSYCIEREIIYY